MICRTCALSLDDSEFYKGFRECKTCSKNRAKQWARENPDRVKQAQKRYRESDQGKRAIESYVYVPSESVIEKARISSRRWREANREAHRAYSKRWARENPDRCRIRDRNSQRRRALGRDESSVAYAEILRNDPCSYCGGPAGHIDHIVPVSDGGGNGWENLAAACISCNSRKRTKTLLHFLVGEAAPPLLRSQP